VLPLSPTTRLVAKTVTPRWVEFDLTAGAASFDVVPNPDREFRVSAGRVRVVVVGTQFSVERQGEHAAVSVQRGRVRVEWERGQQLLVAGERGSFPPVESGGLGKPSRRDEATDDEATASETNAPQEAPPEAASAAPSIGPRGQPARLAPDWRALARRGDFPGAHRVLRDKGKPATPMTFDDLLLAADVTRKSGHPAEALPFLEKALATQVSESRRAVAAFTLGRVRLADLDDPVEAAAAFAQARAAAPDGPLAEDALAREIEARFRSGDRSEARALAEEYVKLWPSGAHVRAVRHFGGLP
jgi:transmembrane sensor